MTLLPHSQLGPIEEVAQPELFGVHWTSCTGDSIGLRSICRTHRAQGDLRVCGLASA